MPLFQIFIPELSIVLMSQDWKGVPTYYGRTDIVDFMVQVPLDAISWKKFILFD
ncbi:MAG: hypothetical protein J0L55_08370 [Caulobacterales bacterium]|nr:hypothetical protein [Caulobacterales bacterium]